MAERNNSFARRFADSVGLFTAKPELDEDSERGEAERRLAARHLVDLRVVRLPQAALHNLYEAPLALIRPDQIVAWRGATANQALGVLSRVIGRSLSRSARTVR